MAQLYSIYQCDDCGTEIRSDNPKFKDWRTLASYRLDFSLEDEAPTDLIDADLCAECYSSRVSNGLNAT